MELFAQWFTLISNGLLVFLVILLLNKEIENSITLLSILLTLIGFTFIYLGGFFDKEIGIAQYLIIGSYSLRVLIMLFRVNKTAKITAVTPISLLVPIANLIILGFNHFFSFIG